MIARTVVAALAVSFVAGCASTPVSLNDNAIVPGERIGDVKIGMPLASLLSVKGSPIDTAPIPDTDATTYGYPGLVVAARDEVYWIIARDARFHTAAGVSPGDSQIAARAAAGKPNCVVTKPIVTVYDYGTYYFTVNNATALVTEVGVMHKTQNC